jgi:hypothetical protein
VSKKAETKAKELPKVNPEDFFILGKDLAGALMGYLHDRPYKETNQLINAFNASKTLKAFLEENKIID